MAEQQQSDSDQRNKKDDAGQQEEARTATAIDQTTAQGDRSVAVGGDVKDSVVATGDIHGNVQQAAIGKHIQQTLIDNLRIVVNQSLPFTPQMFALALAPVFVFAILIWVLLRPAIIGRQAGTAEGTTTPPVCHQVDVVDPGQMMGEFNVAIAQFGEVDAEGRLFPSEDGQRLSQWLYDQLLDEFNSPCPELAIQIWHDSLDPSLKSEEIGTILGDTPEVRAKAAAGLAERIRAHVVIYGHLAIQGDAASFTPEFYVSELPEAEEIVGSHQLGTPIAVQLPIDSLGTRLHLNRKLATRIKILSLFTVALAWDSVHEPGKALALFQQIEQVEGWADDEGKEILYTFIGREAHLLERVEEARGAYERAVALNPDYARARIGLGNLHFDQAQNLLYGKALDFPLLKQAEALVERPGLEQAMGQAISEYQRALDASHDASEVEVETRVHMALGGVHRLKGDVYRRYGDHDSANASFDTAIDEFHKAIAMAGEGQRRVLGQTYLGLAMTYHLKAHTQEEPSDRESLLNAAVEAYDRCVGQAGADPSDLWLDYFKSDFCIPYLNLAEEELLSLREGGGK